MVELQVAIAPTFQTSTFVADPDEVPNIIGDDLTSASSSSFSGSHLNRSLKFVCVFERICTSWSD